MGRIFLITGGTGLVGQELSRVLMAQGHKVRVLSTRQSHNEHAHWDPSQGTMDTDALKGVEAVFHLAGANVAERWTRKHKQAILDSRIQGAETLFQAIQDMPADQRPKAFISASAVGIYPNDPERLYHENDGGAEGFLGDVVRAWEHQADRMEDLGLRVVKLRIGIVLGKNSGVLATLFPIFNWGLGAALGNGMHWMPWIHVNDLARQFLFLAEQEDCQGIWNGVGPESTRNREFSRTLAQILKRPFIAPSVPAWALYLMLGEMAQVGLMSTKCSAAKWENVGFQFHYPTLDTAFEQLLPPSA